MFISQPIRHPLDQLDLVVESLGHPVGVTVPNITHNRLEPAAQSPRDPLQRLLGTLARSLNQLAQCLSGGFVVFTIEPPSQVLYPVNHFTPLGKAPPPLVTRDQLVYIQLIGGLQPPLAQLLEFFGFRLIELFLSRAQDRIKRTHGLLDHMEAVDDVDLVAKDRLDGRKERLGHIQDDHFNSIAFVLRTAREPGHHLVSTSAFARGNRLAFVHVDDHRVVAVPLAPGVFINVNGSPKLSEAAPTAPFNRPAKHGALGEAVATGECSARAPLQAFLSYAGVETLGPLDLRIGTASYAATT